MGIDPAGCPLLAAAPRLYTSRLVDAFTAIAPFVLWRFVKLAALGLFVTGVVGATIVRSRRRRLLLTYGYATPGLVLAYAAGWILMKSTGRAVTEPWILAAITASLGCLHLVFLASHRESVRPATPVLAWACGTAALAVMTVRVTHPPVLAAVLVVGAVVGAIAALPFARVSVRASDGDAAIVWRCFQWIAWIEAGSLLVMLLVNMPLKATMGVSLDAGTGLLGWVHGVMVLVYLQALSSAARVLGLSRAQVALGAVAALLPLAPFIFERRLRARLAPTA